MSNRCFTFLRVTVDEVYSFPNTGKVPCPSALFTSGVNRLTPDHTIKYS